MDGSEMPDPIPGDDSFPDNIKHGGGGGMDTMHHRRRLQVVTSSNIVSTSIYEGPQSIQIQTSAAGEISIIYKGTNIIFNSTQYDSQ
jgi:hypothetical protein